MPFRSLVAGAVAGFLLAFGAAAPVHAAPTVDVGGADYCVGGANTSGMQLGDVTFSGNTPTSSADGCYGIVGGNDSKKAINDLELAWGSGWDFLVKDSGSTSGSFDGISYSLAVGDLGQMGGNWTLTAGPANELPVHVDFIAVLKASDKFALWFFDDVQIDADNNGAWTSVFTNTNAKLQGLSHLSLYVRQGSVPPTDTRPTPTPTSTPTPSSGAVPEPSALALAGLALVAAAVSRRRRRG